MGTGVNSNDTIVYTGYNQGKDAIVNFSVAGTAQDSLDFSSYLKTTLSASSSEVSKQLVATSVNLDKDAEANSVTVLKFVNNTTDKFEALTADKLLSVLNSDQQKVNDPASASFGSVLVLL